MIGRWSLAMMVMLLVFVLAVPFSGTDHLAQSFTVVHLTAWAWSVALNDREEIGWLPLHRLGRGYASVVPTRWDDPREFRGPRVEQSQRGNER